MVKAPARTQKMSNYAQSRKVQWLGQEYTVQYERQADTKLGIVRVDDHTKYYDNRVTVRVLRSDGTEFFIAHLLRATSRHILMTIWLREVLC